MNIGQLLLASARRHPGRPAIASGSAVLATYSQMAAQAMALASGLRRLGIAKFDRIALALPNCPQYLTIQYAAWLAGCVVVPINAKLHAKEMQYIVQHCGASLCLSSGAMLQSLAAAGDIGQCRLIDIDSADFKRLFEDGLQEVCEVAASDPAWLFYTSGTTGRPKGAMLTHRNLLSMTMSYFVDVDQVLPCDVMIHPAPLSHGAGLYALPQVAGAGANVIPESGGFEPAEIFDLIDSWQNVSLFAAPTMVVRLLRELPEQRPKGLKTLVYGGAPMYVEDALKAIECFGPHLFHLYGQGESPMTIAGLPKHLHVDDGRSTLAAELASCGFARTGVELRIVDPDGRELPSGELGEVITRSDCVMAGYWNDPEATERTLRGGWLYTGDMGLMDERGMLVLKDRSKDLIISGGSNIYPREIEEVLLQHPAVRECAVIGAPDPEWGENVVAFVVASDAGERLQAELDTACVNSIARFKRPKQYRFCDSLPKNAYGKILKTELRKLL